MAKYAKNTNVSVEKSRGEIERTLQRYGAERFVYGWDKDNAMIGFQYLSRAVRMVLVLPEKSEFNKTDTGRKRAEATVLKEWDQACKQRWRALLLIIKGKLEGVECGIVTFEDEFLAYTVLPDGSTVSQSLQPEIEKALTAGKMPQLLLPGSEKS